MESLFQHANYTNIPEMREQRHESMPPIEETFACYLSVGKASSLKAPTLPSKPLWVTPCWNGRAYMAVDQASGALHTTVLLQAYQADLRRNLHQGHGLSPACHTSDLALWATETDSCHNQLVNGGDGGLGQKSVDESCSSLTVIKLKLPPWDPRSPLSRKLLHSV